MMERHIHIGERSIMNYSQLGTACGLIVSRLSLGAMTFGEGPLAGELKSRIGQKDADRMVNTALEAGVTLFDTADMYTSGQSEVTLGRALQPVRHRALIATKLGFRSGEAVHQAGLSRRQIIASVEASLSRLATDYIDLYQLHIPDPWTPLEETAAALDDVVRAGKVRYVGYCNYPAWKAQKLVGIQERRGFAKLVSGQMYYSLLGRDIEQETAHFIIDAGLGLLVWSPLASGFLSGKYTRQRPVPPGSRREALDFPPIDKEKGYAVVERLREAAARHNASCAAVAIAWLLAKPFVSSVIVGANSMDQLKDNLRAAEITLPPEETRMLDEVSAGIARYPQWMEPMGADQKIREALEK